MISLVCYDRGLLAVSEIAGVRFRRVDSHGLAVFSHGVSDIIRPTCAVGQCRVRNIVVLGSLSDP